MSTKYHPQRLAGAALIACATLGCGATAHDFVEAKTGIDVGPEVRLCSNGVLHDNPSCRPNGTGGMPWVKNENFDIFSLPPGSHILAQAARRYLGSPYWRGHLQPECKAEQELDHAVNIAFDSINLAAKLDEEINRRFVVDAVAGLRKAGVLTDAEAEAAFRSNLHRLVQQKIRVQLAWFVSTYTGGRYAIEQNQALGRCRMEVQAHAGDGAQFVTGVAGFIVLTNQADVSIKSAQTVAEALSAALGGTLPVIEGSLSSAWERTVGNVIRVNASTSAETETVYPLWVQFE